MEMTLNSNFKTIDNDTLNTIDGGIVIFGVAIAGMTLLKIGGAAALAGVTAGITVGLNNVNRTK